MEPGVLPCPINMVLQRTSAVGVSNEYDTLGCLNARDYLQQLNLFTTEVFVHTQ